MPCPPITARKTYSLASSISRGQQSSSSLKFLTYNTHLFGRTGMIGDHETGLVYRDEERAEQIADRVRHTDADVVGLTEVWDADLRRGIEQAVDDVYPYAISSPYAGGIEDIVGSMEVSFPRATRFLRKYTPHIVDWCSTSHYDVQSHNMFLGALKLVAKHITEDLVFRSIKWSLGLPQAWGAGLLLLSRHPLTDMEFVSHPVRADLEHFADKGILKATVQPEGRTPVTALLTHIQEGNSPRATIAREGQFEELRRLRRESYWPVLAMGDMNDVRAAWLSETLGLTDSFRSIYPDVESRPGYTYDHDNPFAARQGVRGAPNEGKLRIDYIFSDAALIPRASHILREEFRNWRDGSDLSDHFPLLAALAVI